MSTVDVNLMKRTLSFSINGISKGVAFDNLPHGAKIHGATSLHDAGAQVTVLDQFIRQWLKSMGPDLLLSLGEGSALRVKKTRKSWNSGTVVLSGGVTMGVPGGNALVTYRPTDCPGKHGLTRTISTLPDGCSVCGFKNNKVTTVYNCILCDFTTCNTCRRVATVTYPGEEEAGRDAVHAWTFLVEKGTYTTFGIVDEYYRAHGPEHGYINKTDHGWGFYYHDGKLG